MQRFGGHALRVAGARSCDTNTILLIGRWSSHAIQRYIQEASLVRPCRPLGNQDDTQARPSIVCDDELADLRTKLEGLAAKVALMNTPPRYYVVIRKAHLADPREHGAVPAEWRTKCGRPYGLTRFRRSDILDQPCRCFPETPEADGASSETEVMDRRSDESSSSSSSSDSE